MYNNMIDQINVIEDVIIPWSMCDDWCANIKL